ncbi:chymotrypsin-1-like [Diachasma alloeum]|uniref:chymotrypsin-1-like n=1 Tax=Diachasma alloeum TaxID=454923 RepID=UPI0010FBB93C|nr:chymotrypsin-1-like [Diachasma alloeum]
MSRVMIAFGILLSGLALFASGASLPTNNAVKNTHPYQVSFREWVRPDPQNEYVHICSGAIIHKNWILSAASCFEGRDLGYVFAAVGTDEVTNKGQTFDVVFAVFHDDYDKPYNDNIALVRVAGDIEFNDKVRSVALPTDGHDDYDRLGEIVGWFTVKADLSINSHLQSVSLPIIRNEECVKSRDITEKHICVHDEDLGDFCHEDIGAPLIVDNVLVGVESYVAPCAGGLPDVFTRVYNYKQWIDNVIKKFE